MKSSTPSSPETSSVGSTIRTWFQREDSGQIGGLDRTALFFLGVAGIWYCIAYLTGNDTPANNPADSSGWWSWYDQGQYYKTTVELAHGDLEPSVYWYGYPLLGVPFYWWMPRHPYFLPNLAMVLIMAGSFFATCRHFMGRVEAWILVGIFIFFEQVLRAKCLVIPWNTLPAYAAFYLSIYLLLIIRPPRLRYFAICALAGGVALFSRPTEFPGLAILYAFALLNLKGTQRLWAIGFFSFVVLAAGLATLSLNYYFYGHPFSPYINGESRKISFGNYGVKFYQLFCDGTFLTGNAGLPSGTRTTQILERFPYFLLLLPGAIYLMRVRGIAVGGFFLALIVTVGFYLSYNLVDNPPYFWSYGSYHYFWWIIPWMGFLTYLTFRQAFFNLSRTAFSILLGAPVLLYLIIGFKAVAVATSDGKNAVLSVSTNYKDSAYTVQLVSTSKINKLDDIRLQFSAVPSYPGTRIDSAAKVKVFINNRLQAWDGSDYCQSQHDDTYDFSFLAHGPSLHPGDCITIIFTQTSEPQLLRASILKTQFAAGNGVVRLFTP